MRFVNKQPGGGQIRILLMNEYGALIPLWTDDGQTDGEELALSDSLRADLATFSARSEANVPDEVSDDRFDAVPVLRSLASMRYSLRRFMTPAGRRDARAEEDDDMQRVGEGLRDRLQDELGDGYIVTYQH